jgi:hypothetical protein
VDDLRDCGFLGHAYLVEDIPLGREYPSYRILLDGKISGPKSVGEHVIGKADSELFSLACALAEVDENERFIVTGVPNRHQLVLEETYVTEDC